MEVIQMVSFKLVISDPKSGFTWQKEIKDQQAQPFIGLNIGENINGDQIDLPGYELQITGGSDYCGFPMRKGILGIRKKIKSKGGVGFRIKKKGMQLRKTVCAHKIHDKITQINLKVVKEGTKTLAEILGPKEKKARKKEMKVEVKEKKEEKKKEKETKEEKKEK